MASTEDRIAQLEQRIINIELIMRAQSQSQLQPQSPSSAVPASPTFTAPATQPLLRSRQDTILFNSKSKQPTKPISVTQILGWTGATALVLAAVFLIRLALDSGWLTPERQLGMALCGSIILIVLGLRLRTIELHYASLLPAAGIVVQFCTVYGAHLYYHLIGASTATGAVIAICLLTLWVGRKFESEIYVLFAVVGSYSAPLLLPALSGNIMDLVVYFSGWSTVYCLHSIGIGNRRPYLLAGYMAFIGFQIATSNLAVQEWASIFTFQIIQFVIFVCGTVAFSIRQNRPMSAAEANAHLPLLLIFYALQYALLHRHVPTIAPWIALASAATLLMAHVIARQFLSDALTSSNALVATYVALVLFHAVYLELLPFEVMPWTGFFLLIIGAVYLLVLEDHGSILLPYRLLIGVIFFLNYVQVIVDGSMQRVVGNSVVALFYAIELYVAYYLSGRVEPLKKYTRIILFGAHIALMAAAVKLLDGRLQVSIAWSAIAFVSLWLAFNRRDKILGQSSLLIFAASCAKVMLFDLSDATSLVRIGSLLVLGVTLYAGGWMYKKVETFDAPVAEK